MSTQQRRVIERRKRALYYMRRWGITLEEFEQLLLRQQYLCHVCDDLITPMQIKCIWAEEGVPIAIVHRPCLTASDRPYEWTRRNREFRARLATVPRVQATAPSTS